MARSSNCREGRQKRPFVRFGRRRRRMQAGRIRGDLQRGVQSEFAADLLAVIPDGKYAHAQTGRDLFAGLSLADPLERFEFPWRQAGPFASPSGAIESGDLRLTEETLPELVVGGFQQDVSRMRRAGTSERMDTEQPFPPVFTKAQG